jgi:YrbI family 3-deoxy-D-manno-octulosonate 8-phosphate phosphatase
VIDTVLLDVDGVLTDGAVYVDSSGKETKRILFDDIDAVFELKRAGIKIGFITGEDNEFCRYVKKRFEPDFFIAGCKDKLNACKRLMEQESLELTNMCYAGDSKKDMLLLEYLPLSFAPADVDPCIRAAAKVVLKSSRGQGIVRELADQILQNQTL